MTTLWSEESGDGWSAYHLLAPQLLLCLAEMVSEREELRATEDREIGCVSEVWNRNERGGAGPSAPSSPNPRALEAFSILPWGDFLSFFRDPANCSRDGRLCQDDRWRTPKAEGSTGRDWSHTHHHVCTDDQSLLPQIVKCRVAHHGLKL